MLSIPEYLMLNYVDTYYSDIPTNIFQSFWKFRYNADPATILKTLQNYDLIVVADIRTTLNKSTIPKLKECLRKNNLSVTGKKDELIDRILSNMDLKTVSSDFPLRYFQLTDKGKAYKNSQKFENILWIHRHYDYGMDANEIPDNVRAQEFVYNELSKKINYYANKQEWGLYRNTRHSMANILIDEGILEGAFQWYIEVCALDIALKLPNEEIDIYPGILNPLCKLSRKLKYVENPNILYPNILAALENVTAPIHYENINDVTLFLTEKIKDISYTPTENLILTVSIS